MRFLTLLLAAQILLAGCCCLASAAAEDVNEIEFPSRGGGGDVQWETSDYSGSSNSNFPKEDNDNDDPYHALFRGRRNRNDELSLSSAADSCYDSIFDCATCANTTRCHWCQHDQRCHIIGSVYGCLSGMQCDRKHDDDKPKDSCSAYQNCSACANTRTCHWCAHDDSCHTIGSLYGCVRGVDCFAEDRCRRHQSEPLPSSMRQHFTNMGVKMLMVVGAIGCIAIFFLSSCLCFAWGLKGSYDDLWYAVHSSSSSSRRHHQISTPARSISATIPADEAQRIPSNSETVAVGRSPAAAVAATSSDPEPDNNIIRATKKSRPRPKKGKSRRAEDAEIPGEDRPASESDIPCQALEEEHQQQQQEQTPLVSRSTTAVTFPEEEESIRSSNGSKRMRMMLGACTFLYVFSVFLIGGLVVGAVRLFPKIPQYSVCNDSVAWKKLIDSMAKLKAEVDFEILLSIENANHVDVVLDSGGGVFKHSGIIVGNYKVPPVIAPAMAITDVLVLATLTADKWETLSLTKEYYKGHLVLDVDAELYLRLPALLNFSKQVNITNRHININQEEDRHLCACKKWDNSNNSTQHYLLEENFLSVDL